MSVRRSPAPVRLAAAPVRLAAAPVRTAPTGAASLVAVLRAGEEHRRRRSGNAPPQPVGAKTDPWESFFESASRKLAKEPPRPATPPSPQQDVKITTKIADLQARLARCNREQEKLLRELETNAAEKKLLDQQNGALIEKYQELLDEREEAEAPEPPEPKGPYEAIDAEKAEALAEARERYVEDPAYEGPNMSGWGSLTDENRARAAKLAEEESILQNQLKARDAERDSLRRIIADAQKRGALKDPSMPGSDFYDPGFGFGASVENA